VDSPKIKMDGFKKGREVIDMGRKNLPLEGV
jgi:hypothetical protein